MAGAEEGAGQGAGLARLEGGAPSLVRLYSGHDTTLTFLLHSLGLYDGTPPPYASAVIFELYQDQNKTFRSDLHLSIQCLKVYFICFYNI